MYLSLRGVVVPASSTVSLSDIGSSSNALVCITDRPNCCRTTRQGEWFFPTSVNGSDVTTGGGAVFARNRTDNGMINLNRVTDATPPSGLYCCKVLDAVAVEQTVCTDIGTLFLCCVRYSLTLSSLQFLLLLKSLAAWSLQVQERCTPSPVT